MKLSKDNSTKIKINNILKNGGVIAFVTDTVWGLGCLPNNEKAVKKIYEIKRRDTSKPLILMSSDFEYLKPFVKNVSEKAKTIMGKFFPGALTLVFERSEITPLYITSNMNTIGVRVPNNPIFKDLCELTDGHVLATTSANFSGQAPALDCKTVTDTLKNFVDIIIEDEYSPATGEPSTVAKVNDSETIIYRQGNVKIQ